MLTMCPRRPARAGSARTRRPFAVLVTLLASLFVLLGGAAVLPVPSAAFGAVAPALGPARVVDRCAADWQQVMPGPPSYTYVPGLCQLTLTVTGSPQTVVVPAGVQNMTIYAAGAQGGSSECVPPGPQDGAPRLDNAGGGGGFASSNAAVSPGQVFTIMVGGIGGTGTDGKGGAPGYGGGAAGGANIGQESGGAYPCGAGGGGGGGGTFVYGPSGELLVAAPGGGGASLGDGGSAFLLDGDGLPMMAPRLAAATPATPAAWELPPMHQAAPARTRLATAPRRRRPGPGRPGRRPARGLVVPAAPVACTAEAAEAAVTTAAEAAAGGPTTHREAKTVRATAGEAAPGVVTSTLS